MHSRYTKIETLFYKIVQDIYIFETNIITRIYIAFIL
jgi:hypothetical protein